MNNEEIDTSAVDRLPMDSGRFSDRNSVRIEDGSFRWSNLDDAPLILNKSVMDGYCFFVADRVLFLV